MHPRAYAAAVVCALLTAITLIVVPTIMLSHSLAHVTWPA